MSVHEEMFSCPTIVSPLSKWTVIAPEEGSKSTVPVVHWPFVLAAITVWWLSVRLANLKEGGGKLAQDERKLSTSYATSNWSQFRLQHNLLSCLWVPTSLCVSMFSDVRSPPSLLYWYRQNLLQFKGPIVPHKKMWGTILNNYYHEYFPCAIQLVMGDYVSFTDHNCTSSQASSTQTISRPFLYIICMFPMQVTSWMLAIGRSNKMHFKQLATSSGVSRKLTSFQEYTEWEVHMWVKGLTSMGG